MPVTEQYARIMSLMKSGTVAELEFEAQRDSYFPEGVDGVSGRRWILNAIDSGSAEAVNWMLEKGVDIGFVDDEGRSPLLAVLERDKQDRYELLEALLAAGAPVNAKGFNDFAPLHQAASWDDVKALRLLVQYGADLTLRTCIDDYATPLEVAKSRGSKNAIMYLRTVV